MFAVIFGGCGMLEAPSVSDQRPDGNGSVNVDQAVTGGCETQLGGNTPHVLQVPIKKRNDQPWVYWSAGTHRVEEEPSAEWIQSTNWDMRITRRIPIVSANGGQTAVGVSKLSASDAHAAFLLLTNDFRRKLPSVADLKSIQNWSEDRFEGIEFGDQRLIPDYQNPLVNRIGTELGNGLASDYNPYTHKVTLSGNVFVLRSTSGNEYYAIRFCEYSQADKWIRFQWLELKE